MIISIHALLAESDCVKRFHATDISYFYPRSPCGERPKWSVQHYNHHEFLSTLSLRRATRCRIVAPTAKEAISIHALLAESDKRYFESKGGYEISIHALLAESDLLADLYLYGT